VFYTSTSRIYARAFLRLSDIYTISVRRPGARSLAFSQGLFWTLEHAFTLLIPCLPRHGVENVLWMRCASLLRQVPLFPRNSTDHAYSHLEPLQQNPQTSTWFKPPQNTTGLTRFPHLHCGFAEVLHSISETSYTFQVHYSHYPCTEGLSGLFTFWGFGAPYPLLGPKGLLCSNTFENDERFVKGLRTRGYLVASISMKGHVCRSR